MRKTTAIIIVLAILIVSVSAAYAASEPKSASVSLSDTPASVNVGETVRLSAVSEKHGSSYTDCWSNAAAVSTVYDEEAGSYVSEAEFKAERPGTYTISYEIKMQAGKSAVEFSGKVERTIEVIGALTLTGAEIRDLVFTPVFRSDGSIAYYKAVGNVYKVWSDRSTVLYGSIFFNFGAGEPSKNVTVTVYDNGNRYTWLVTVNRP